MKLLVERQRHIIYVKVGMFNVYLLFHQNDYTLVFVMVFVNRFGRRSVRNMGAGWCYIGGFGLSL